MVGAPVEAAFAHPLQWLSEKSIYEELLHRPKDWFVKVLVRLHPMMPSDILAHQISKLKELSSACLALHRSLMLELLMPEGFDSNGENLSAAMSYLYENHLFPLWWKIEAPGTKHEWKSVCAVMDRHDPEVRVVILGKGAKIEELARGFAVVGSSRHAIGFAVGRTIFWPVWEAFIAQKLPLEQVSKNVASRFLECIECWQKRRVLGEQAIDSTKRELQAGLHAYSHHR